MLDIQRVVTGSEPITLLEAKQYLRVLYDADDDVIEQLITQARQTLEQATNLSLVEQDITLVNDSYLNKLRLPYGPITAVTSIDLDGEDILSTALYDVGRIVYSGDGVLTVEYSAGGVEQQGVKLAMLELIAHNFMNRGTDKPIPASVKRWILNHSLNTFA
jgi:hypothetical protein